MDFRLTDSFVEEYKKIEPDWGPLGKITYLTKYSRTTEEDRLEDWWETLRRVVEGCYTIQGRHCEHLKLPWHYRKAQTSAQQMYSRMFSMKFLPAGRGLKMMGTDFMWNRSSMCLINCTYISSSELSTDFAEPFCFIADVSMMGCGSSIDTRGAGQVKIRQPRYGDYVFTVEDTREGWIELIRTILNSYVGKGSIPKEVDYSKIRPYGAPIKGLGGQASGPDPLRQLVQDIQDILNPSVDEYISSTNIVDLANSIARCIVSGNLRRSAQIVLGSIDDKDFLELKDPDKHKDKLSKLRWVANDTVMPKIGSDYTEVAQRTAKTGEPGFYWVENAQHYGRMKDGYGNKDPNVLGINACGELPLESYGICNLVEVFPARHENYEDFERSLKYAYLYAKSVTLLPTHNPRTNAVILRSRRIGISQSGIAQAIAKLGLRTYLNWCDKGYKYLKDIDALYSDWLCVQKSIKITTVKPSGTVSLLPQATPGIHYPFSKHYLRAMRFDKKSPIVKALKKAGHVVEDDVVDASSSVVYFPVEEKDFARARKDLSIWEQAELVAQMQYWWSDNAVSATLTFSPEEAKDIPRILSLYETRLKSISFLPLRDHQYKQAPYQEISEAEYKKAIKKIKPFDFNDIGIEKYSKHAYCNSDRCEILTKEK